MVTVPARHSVSWAAARYECGSLCRSCDNCAYISVSPEFKDCSWFLGCNLSALDHSVRGFRSYRADDPLLRHIPPYRRWELASNATCDVCAPTQACRDQIVNWVFGDTHRGLGFWVGETGALKRLTGRLPALLRCESDAEESLPLVMLDIGAGSHGNRNTPDDSDSLLLLSKFRARAEVHAFEINRDKAYELVELVRTRLETRNFSRQLHVHNVGVGSAASTVRVANCGHSNTWRVWDAMRDSKKPACDVHQAIPQVSVDEFTRANLIDRVFYIKTDVEGGEWAVMDGMDALLRARRVELMSFEYAMNWHPLYTKKGAVPEDERASIGATLFNFQKRMLEHGYDTYLIHGRGKHVTLVPVYGGFWTNEWELCFDRARAYGAQNKRLWCWNDVLVVRRCSTCIKPTLLHMLHHGRRVFPACNCL